MAGGVFCSFSFVEFPQNNILLLPLLFASPGYALPVCLITNFSTILCAKGLPQQQDVSVQRDASTIFPTLQLSPPPKIRWLVFWLAVAVESFKSTQSALVFLVNTGYHHLLAQSVVDSILTLPPRRAHPVSRPTGTSCSIIYRSWTHEHDLEVGERKNTSG